MAYTSFWTPARVRALKALWQQGETGSAIAAELGTTRGAVLGKLGRCGLLNKMSQAERSRHIVVGKAAAQRCTRESRLARDLAQALDVLHGGPVS